MIRYSRGTKETVRAAVVDELTGLDASKQEKILILKFSTKQFRAVRAQWVWMRLPYLSESDWHPFSVVRTPDPSKYELHIIVKGTYVVWKVIGG